MLAEIVNRGDYLGSWEAVSDVLHQWLGNGKASHPQSTVSTLPFTSCSEPAVSNLCPAELLFRLMSLSPSDEALDTLKIGCFKYFERGGDCVAGPAVVLSLHRK